MNKDKRILFLNLPGFEHAVSSVSINLGIASIAAVTRQIGHKVRVLDLNLYENYYEKLKTTLCEYSPDFIGFGICTPQTYVARDIVAFTKSINENICIIGGGPHPSALPIETLNETNLDIVCQGEGDGVVGEIINNYYTSLKNVKGKIFFKEQGKIHRTYKSNLINIEELPFPALDLFEIDKYIYPSQSCRNNPVTLLETSRGCPGNCVFCSRIIAGKTCRYKSAERVLKEFEYAKNLGFQEIHFADDNFITDQNRAIRICDLLIEHKLNIPWVPRSGVRVDYVNEHLLRKMKDAGCYHVPYGIESTDQNILNSCNKGIGVYQIENAIKMTKELGMEVTGYFMVGLPGQTVDDIKRDIDFAENMELDFVKFGVTIPYPGTRLFNDLKTKQKILTYDWGKYHYDTLPYIINEQENIKESDFKKINIGNQKLYQLLNLVLNRNFQPIK